jgi:hypothetical protein
VLIRPQQILEYFLHKQYLSRSSDNDLSVPKLLAEIGPTEEKDLLRTLRLRDEKLSLIRLRRYFLDQELVEVKSFRGRRYIVPESSVRDYTKFIPKKQFQKEIIDLAKEVREIIKNEPTGEAEVIAKLSDSRSIDIKSALDLLESNQHILKIRNFETGKYDYVDTRDYLGDDVHKVSDEKSLSRILVGLVQGFGPISLTDLTRYVGLDSELVSAGLRGIRGDLSVVKMGTHQYLMSGLDLAAYQKFHNQEPGYINVVPLSDRALALSSRWLKQCIPLYSELESIVVYKGRIAGAYSKTGGFDNFTKLNRNVLGEISKKHLELQRWKRGRFTF